MVGSRSPRTWSVATRALQIALLATCALWCIGSAPAEDDKDAPSKKAKSASKKKKTTPKKPDAGVDEPVEYPLPQKIKVPDGILDGGKGWLNTTGDITLKDLRGKIVVFDFWTYCCINCMHVLPDLKMLEEKYPTELVVIGVHSAKFDTEKETESIRRAIMRYEIKHPVVNDANMLIWRKFGISSWPTLLIVDAEGNACFATSGEGKGELLDFVIGKLVKYHKSTKTLDETPIRFDLETEKAKPTPLRFPGKVLADEKSNRLYISDSNHNRIVVTTLDGKLIELIGTGAIGADDGSYAKATFDHPQGAALLGDVLYVADTEKPPGSQDRFETQNGRNTLRHRPTGPFTHGRR